MNLKSFKQELLNDPEFKKEYNKKDLAFEIGQVLIEARIVVDMIIKKLAKKVNNLTNLCPYCGKCVECEHPGIPCPMSSKRE